MNNQLQTLIKILKKRKKETYKNRALNEFGEIPRIWRIDSFQKSKFR